MNYILIENNSILDDALTYIRESEILALDIETTGLNPNGAKLRLIQLKTLAGKIYIIDVFKFNLQELGEKLRPIFQDPKYKFVIHNGSFEYKFFLHHLKIRIATIFDTYLAAILADFEAEHKLGTVLEQWLQVNIDKSEQTSDWSGVLTQSQLNYAANDVEYLLPLREKLLEKLRQTAQLKAAKLEFDIIPAVSEAELVGFPIDVKKHEQLMVYLEIERNKKYKRLNDWFRTNGGKEDSYQVLIQESLFGETIELETEESINIKSQKQLIKRFKELGIDIDSTNAKILGAMKAQYPELALLLDFRESEKLVTTYGRDFVIQNVYPLTGRIHPSILQFGAKTARFSMTKPNLQNQPNNEEFRNIYSLTDPNRRLIIADYAGYELRALADTAMDEVMLQAFAEGKDLHSVTGSLIWNLPYNEMKTTYKSKRYLAKQINFSLVYGISAIGLVLRFKNEGLDVTEEEAQAMIDGWYKAYPQAAQWLWNREKVIIRDKGHMRGVGGHLMIYDFDPNDKKSLGSAKRASRNFLIQNNNACATKRATKLLNDELINNYPSAQIVNFVHDEIILECDEEDSQEIELLLQEKMIKGAKEYLQTVKVEVSSAIGTSWSDKE